MNLFLGALVALAAGATATEYKAAVYMPARECTTGSMSNAVASLILQHRLLPSDSGLSISDLPDGTNIEDTIMDLHIFGKRPLPLLSSAELSEPRQLMVVMEGMSLEQVRDIGKDIEIQPSFEIVDVSSETFSEQLVPDNVFQENMMSARYYSLTELTNPLDERCWTGNSILAKYNAKKSPELLEELQSKLPQIKSLAWQGEMETTIVLLTTESKNSNNKHWYEGSQELRRRQTEQSLADGQLSSPASPKPGSKFLAAPSSSVPSCFGSEDSCMSSTGSCSGHGFCQNKYANPDGSEGRDVCFLCYCRSTKSESGSITHWAGATCMKQDVSVPFWLFAGFTIAMVSILSLSIGMLFSVGQEKLPGVIGAGVSRTK